MKRRFKKNIMDSQVENKSLSESELLPGKNQLYPIFLKLDQLEILLVGAGNVGLEKLHSLLSNSPAAKAASTPSTAPACTSGTSDNRPRTPTELVPWVHLHFDVRCSMLNVRCCLWPLPFTWMLRVGCWMLDVGCSVF